MFINTGIIYVGYDSIA